jgi:hypothetical protein
MKFIYLCKWCLLIALNEQNIIKDTPGGFKKKWKASGSKEAGQDMEM